MSATEAMPQTYAERKAEAKAEIANIDAVEIPLAEAAIEHTLARGDDDLAHRQALAKIRRRRSDLEESVRAWDQEIPREQLAFAERSAREALAARLEVTEQKSAVAAEIRELYAALDAKQERYRELDTNEMQVHSRYSHFVGVIAALEDANPNIRTPA